MSKSLECECKLDGLFHEQKVISEQEVIIKQEVTVLNGQGPLWQECAIAQADVRPGYTVQCFSILLLQKNTAYRFFFFLAVSWNLRRTT